LLNEVPIKIVPVRFRKPRPSEDACQDLAHLISFHWFHRLLRVSSLLRSKSFSRHVRRVDNELLGSWSENYSRSDWDIKSDRCRIRFR